MARWPKVSAYEFKRTFRGQTYEGEAFFDTREQCQAIAREVRRRGVPARAVIIPESYTDGGHHGGYVERYILMLPINQEVAQDVLDYIHQQSKER